MIQQSSNVVKINLTYFSISSCISLDETTSSVSSMSSNVLELIGSPIFPRKLWARLLNWISEKDCPVSSLNELPVSICLRFMMNRLVRMGAYHRHENSHEVLGMWNRTKKGWNTAKCVRNGCATWLVNVGMRWCKLTTSPLSPSMPTTQRSAMLLYVDNQREVL